MKAPLTCESAREAAADLALGDLSGDERAIMLEHLSGCPACSALVGELSSVVDSLLLLAPEVDPPPRFESAVLARIAPGTVTAIDGPVASRRSWKRRAAIIGSAAAAAVILVGGTIALRPGDGSGHEYLADETASALAHLGGHQIRAGALVGPNGKAWGQAFVYEGQTSWVFLDMSWDVPNGSYTVMLDRADGPSLAMGNLHLLDGMGSTGHTVGDTTDITAVRVIDAQGHTVCTARLPTDSS